MIKHQNKIIADATTAQQAKELKALTAALKEQASRKVGRHCGGETRCTGYLSWPER